MHLAKNLCFPTINIDLNRHYSPEIGISYGLYSVPLYIIADLADLLALSDIVQKE